MSWRALVFGMCGVVWSNTLSAALIVNAPQPITRLVTVQLIQTASDSGAPLATAFGDATQRADIEAGIDTIWAQAGIDIKILPSVTRYNNTFAYQGTVGSGTRPQGDLNTIVANARAAGLLNSDPLVIDLFLVNVVPAFTPLSENTAAGLAFISSNGITGFVGDNLLTYGDGRDVISSVFAHEIGHNLGLNHTPNGTANLMSPNGTSQQLTTDQISTTRSSTFARAFTAATTGDYNGNGGVDAADYVVWRNSLNKTGTGLAADGNGNGQVDAGDYTVWRSHFGSTAGSGAATGDNASSPISGINGVPEPNSVVYLLFCMASIASFRHRTPT